MKSHLHLLALVLLPLALHGQQIILDYDSTKAPNLRLVKVTKDEDVKNFDPFATILIRINNFPDTPTVQASFNGSFRTADPTGQGTIAIRGLSAEEVDNYSSYSIFIDCAGETATYSEVAKPRAAPSKSAFPEETAQQAIGLFFGRYETTEFGIQIPEGSPKDPTYRYTGAGYTHIFLDQFGNSIVGVIPQGIANRQYVVDIFYLSDRANPNELYYSVKQTKGSYSTAVVFNNAGKLSDIGAEGSLDKGAVKYTWKHTSALLRTSTDQIEFELYKNALGDTGTSSFSSEFVSKNTIDMSPVYHGSFDIGLLSSFLENPTYELLSSAGNTEEKVVKRSDDGNRGIMTAMATLYTSPIILFEKLLGVGNIPNYKLTGRSFLDDHKIYERIFPAIGVSITEKAFKNLFYGLNWEVARGASVFFGYHYGEVNVFDKPEGFIFGETSMNDADYAIRTRKRWKNDFAIGANLDVSIISNLFRK